MMRLARIEYTHVPMKGKGYLHIIDGFFMNHPSVFIYIYISYYILISYGRYNKPRMFINQISTGGVSILM